MFCAQASTLKKLDRPRRPAGDVVGQQLEHLKRSLAATIANQVATSRRGTRMRGFSRRIPSAGKPASATGT